MAERLSEAVRSRFRAPRFALTGALAGGGATGASGARAAGALVEVHLGVGGDGALHARFRAYGDPATIAAAEWVCEQVDGALPPVSPPAVAAVSRALALPASRQHAAQHAVDALRAALGRLD
ncbi:MAG: iron-sulfur cluster assembly scaffold protein [Pseudomonadota bacterium]